VSVGKEIRLALTESCSMVIVEVSILELGKPLALANAKLSPLSCSNKLVANKLQGCSVTFTKC
jgi:hypothetical protein